MGSKNKAVAITGMGIISSLGEGVKSFRDALFQGQSFFSRLSYPSLSFPVIAAGITDFSFSHALKNIADLTEERTRQLEKLARQATKPIQLAMIAALEAWQHAHLFQRPPENQADIGIVVAAQNSTGRYQYDLHDSFIQNPDYLSPSYALHFMDSDYVGIISEMLKILGEGFTVGASSASGNVALLRMYQLIRDDWQKIGVVIGAAADLSPMELQAFHNIGALGGHHYADKPNQACRPFDEAHEGFIFGQASACIILESIESAHRRQSPILGYMLGGSLCLDANHLSNPQQIGEERVMRQALKRADVKIEDINYINTHGTSAPVGDQTEIDAIENLLGKHSSSVMINSTKSITGHCLWAAGVVEALATIIQLRDGFVHPTLNLEHPITSKSQLVAGQSKPWKIQTALSNGFGFGGINTSLVFSKESEV